VKTSDRLTPNEFQPRAYADGTRLQELAQSIKSNGVIQPIIVRRVGDRNPPSRAYKGEPRRDSQSLRLTDVAATRTRTCPAAGDGVGTSSTRSTSGGP